MAARQAMGATSGGLALLAMLAEAHGVANQHDEALQVLAEALDFWDRTGEGIYLPEIHRLKGELLLRQNAPDAAVEAGWFAFAKRSMWPAANNRNYSNSGRRLAWLGCGAIKGWPRKDAICWRRFTAGSPKASTRPTSRTRRRFSTIWFESVIC